MPKYVKEAKRSARPFNLEDKKQNDLLSSNDETKILIPSSENDNSNEQNQLQTPSNVGASSHIPSLENENSNEVTVQQRFNYIWFQIIFGLINVIRFIYFKCCKAVSWVIDKARYCYDKINQVTDYLKSIWWLRCIYKLFQICSGIYSFYKFIMWVIRKIFL